MDLGGVNLVGFLGGGNLGDRPYIVDLSIMSCPEPVYPFFAVKMLVFLNQPKTFIRL